MKKPKPLEQFTGLTLEQWQANFENIRWTQLEPRFRSMLSVVLHQLEMVPATCSNCSGERAFGRVEGYKMALDVLRSLGVRPPKEQPPIEATHDEPPEKAFRPMEPLD